ncbi:MAG: Cys-tRNA(Pro) deacylase [SAR324 cluster bacterium]|nr:Cys-tRNA(Pro) deacylase [SAR324 cluster bacterium]
MTPAVNSLKSNKTAFTLHQYKHNPDVVAFGDEVVAELGVSADVVYKTLVVVIDKKSKQMAVSIVPVSKQLDFKALAKAAGVKRAFMAPADETERVTGYVLGGISPLGQRTILPTFVDDSILSLKSVYVSAGKRGLQIELTPKDLILLTKAETAPIVR